jgi:hypothetical protein
MESTFDRRNQVWRGDVFLKGGELVAAEGTGENSWKYLYKNVQFAFSNKHSKRTCGENGGVCANGASCKYKGKLDGRCAKHPYSNVCITLRGGNDGAIRPFPCNIPWEDMIIEADGMIIETEQPPCDVIEGFYSMTHVYNDTISDTMTDISIPSDCVATHEGNVIALNPLWSVEKLLQLYPNVTVLNGRKIVRGFNLQDYSVKPNIANSIS